MLPAITEKTDAYLNIAEVAVLLDVPPTELGIWRKVGLLPAPVATLRVSNAGRPRLLWDRATMEAFKASRAKPAQAA
jgi:hypothetical protein